MNTSEIIDLLKKAINGEEIADVEVKECQRFIDGPVVGGDVSNKTLVFKDSITSP